MEDETTAGGKPVEFGGEFAGQKLWGKNLPIRDVAMLIMAGVMIWGAVKFDAHGGESKADAKEQTQAVAKAADQIVQAIKEIGAANNAAIKELTVEQKKSTAAARETNCLVTLPEAARSVRAEVCKNKARYE